MCRVIALPVDYRPTHYNIHDLTFAAERVAVGVSLEQGLPALPAGDGDAWRLSGHPARGQPGESRREHAYRKGWCSGRFCVCSKFCMPLLIEFGSICYCAGAGHLRHLRQRDLHVRWVNSRLACSRTGSFARGAGRLRLCFEPHRRLSIDHRCGLHLHLTISLASFTMRCAGSNMLAFQSHPEFTYEDQLLHKVRSEVVVVVTRALLRVHNIVVALVSTHGFWLRQTRNRGYTSSCRRRRDVASSSPSHLRSQSSQHLAIGMPMTPGDPVRVP